MIQQQGDRSAFQSVKHLMRHPCIVSVIVLYGIPVVLVYTGNYSACFMALDQIRWCGFTCI